MLVGNSVRERCDKSSTDWKMRFVASDLRESRSLGFCVGLVRRSVRMVSSA